MKCTALLTCEKIIVDKDGAHSIINVMLNAEILLQQMAETGSALAAPIPPDTPVIPIPPDAVAPQIWWIYSIWQPSPEDVGKSFEQAYQVYWPNSDDKFMDQRINFALKDERAMQTTFHIGGLPIGRVGKIKVVTWLDYQGHRVTEVSETYFNIKHRTTVPESAPTFAARLSNL
jgi:hypothetical protein